MGHVEEASKNIRPAGTTLHANDTLPINDNRYLFEQVCWVMAIVLNSANSDNRAAGLSSGSFASWLIVSSKIPSSGRLVVGPITFSGLISEPTWPQMLHHIHEGHHASICLG